MAIGGKQAHTLVYNKDTYTFKHIFYAKRMGLHKCTNSLFPSGDWVEHT